MKLSYIAGLFDGEGCISQHVNRSGVPERYKKPRNVLQVSITNTYLPVLETIKAFFGFGCIHKLTRKAEHHKQCYSWTVTGKRARMLLGAIAPYLIIKKEKALGVIHA